ncbi:MAG: hypothetical protein QM728_13535 [Gordonia sp. (in: high G+C Gram-positive bacteria)]|uniref:hypothetical protein n=1 Tax=Gordonia sp. (in: high G+C Gram-positive bacteria) TaxID=84139 RepID=UPI0039E4D190
MKKLLLAVASAALLTGAPAAPAHADIGIRDTRTADLFVRAERPTGTQMGREALAFWNPSVPKSEKLKVVRGGAKESANLTRMFSAGKTYDLFSVTGRAAGAPQIAGDTMSVRFLAKMAGIPSLDTTYFYFREGGLWKLDMKRYVNANPELKKMGWTWSY